MEAKNAPSFNLDDIPERMTDEEEDMRIRHGPVEGIGTWSGLQYTSLPAEELLGKMEETYMGDEDDPSAMAEQMIERTREVLREKDRAAPFMAAGETFRDPSAQSFALNLRYPGMEPMAGMGERSEWPNHSEMFHGFMDDDPSFMQGAPSLFGRKGTASGASGMDHRIASGADHTTVRARRMEVAMGNNDYAGIVEPRWQNHQISHAKKETQERSKRTLNIWEWPSYVNEGGKSTSRKPEAGASAREIQIKNDIAAGSESIGAYGGNARDQYGRIMRNRTGGTWYTLPWVRHGQDLHLESTTQPKGVIAENSGESVSLLYSVIEPLNQERSTGNRGDRRTGTEQLNPLAWTQGMQEMQDEIEARREGTKRRFEDMTVARRDQVASFDSESRLWNTVRMEHPRGDAIKMKRETLVEPVNAVDHSGRAMPSANRSDQTKARGMAVTEVEGGYERDGYGTKVSQFIAPGDRLGHDMDITEHWETSDQDAYRDFAVSSGGIPEDMTRARRDVLFEDDMHDHIIGEGRSEGKNRAEPGAGRWSHEATADVPLEWKKREARSAPLGTYMFQSRVRDEDDPGLSEYRPFTTSYSTSSSFRTPSAARVFDREAL